MEGGREERERGDGGGGRDEGAVVEADEDEGVEEQVVVCLEEWLGVGGGAGGGGGGGGGVLWSKMSRATKGELRRVIHQEILSEMSHHAWGVAAVAGGRAGGSAGRVERAVGVVAL